MKKRYRLIRRGTRGGTYYCVDSQTGSRTSLGKISADEAEQIVQHKNTAVRQPMLNLQIARAYLAGSDSGVTTRTWGNALQSHLEMKAGANLKRWTTFSKDKAIKPLLPKILIETQAEELLNCVKNGTVSTNIFKAFYKMAWHLGASQSDLASLKAEDVDWDNQVITFFRMKTKWRSVQPTQIRFGKEVEAILKDLPKEGLLFPYLATVRAGDRATEFKQRCDGLGIKGVSLHSYRYAWAERAQVAGYPERFAQKALGHNSKAVHRAYARRAEVTLPPLEEYESKVIPFSPRPSKSKSAAG